MRHSNSGDTFEIYSDPIEVTSLDRPDEGWSHTDTFGHVHQWEWPDGRRVYQPGQRASLPTLKWVIDGTAYYPDGEPYTYGHYECQECGDHVTPRRKADEYRQFIPGLRTYLINGQGVSEEEFMERARAAGLIK